ncbi:hypothetical protein MMAD_45070 [Mycolicibacterium madagascariense]|uniref:34 kDa antigenic protein n=1 Tax=Mycolicibacterium madagascariense TaxID=212765 RepID=A0A7I7XME2_9MYCO|nr:DUF5336 domain-containing protein [Mycolicibacterium madagascariense]MCV7012532.1 DUF5336 domain-containing protein [Mycolicibacterium madagascariense]BBZ30212.1 hypothetical protein MMAD_45070 [Mycolicibacterium madagascariense]
MSYPSGPTGNSGYPSGPPAHYNAPTQQFGNVQDAAPAGPSKVPFYLDIAIVVLGLAAYLTTFALGTGTTIGPVAAVLAGLLAGVGLVPKQKSHFGVVAVLAVLGFLVILSDVITVGVGNVGWPWYLLLLFTLLQAAAAVAGLLLDAGVITAPAPKPKYDHNPYGQYGPPSPYYGQPQGQPQRGGYPQQPYGGYPSGPSTGGFAGQSAPQPPQGGSSQGGSPQGGSQHGGPQQGGAQPGGAQQSGPPTPPTGFPAFGGPQGSNSSQTTQSFESQQPQQQPAPQSTPPPS